ncbi:DHA2 family efflux MFS transporter permease subunit [Staphylococcus coagulans]|uniref:DHA2 family efflux MFS transporter permease subunit n=1 Tax=Staphylococcus coagulans TaxID=74706 RepID=UPI001BED3853|nr:DHA2 family efflux MFS transporter permease subunit [Staphylococcus coagulans]MDU9269540.1 DHA2 family efflux MFS transporter permease subunit [Staphylococcus coagulans]MDU9281690.1 DHA2 family efflux MFS transporter permease subunit [Staphylococcus coagulans]MDU9292683.1 DHA2 family efflux MFS transporter permease subunit [Staphylococcus coagulans]MDU9305953.1 DHA2 family efflux MFS transporter permease subunit [Staphylococcus coagulans]MDU9323066.1 DHA2 family efflux MFS transporter perme
MSDRATSNDSMQHHIPAIAMMMIGAFIAVLNQTLMTTVIPKIMEEFRLTSGTAQWLTTIFMLVNGIMIPITAYLTQRFSLRRLFFTAMLLFVVGSLLCMLAPNFTLLLVGRAIQAMGAGILMPLTQMFLFLVFPLEKRGMAMGLFGLVIGFAPAIGPTAAGWFVTAFDWRYLFLIILIISVIDLLFGYFKMMNLTELSKPKLDILSVILSTVGFGGLLFGFSSASQFGWGNPIIYLTLLVAVVTLVTFVMRQLKLETPMLEIRVFQYRAFTIPISLVILMFLIFIGTLTILPIYMQTMRGLTPLQSGLILLPGGLVMGLLSPVTGKLYDIIGGRILAVSGMMLIFIGTLLLSFLNAESSITYIVLSFLVMMLGNSGIMVPMTTEALNALPRELIPHGTAMNNTLRQISAAIGTGLLVTLLTQLAMGHGGSIVASHIFGLQWTYKVVAFLSLIGTLIALRVSKKESSN